MGPRGRVRGGAAAEERPEEVGLWEVRDTRHLGGRLSLLGRLGGLVIERDLGDLVGGLGNGILLGLGGVGARAGGGLLGLETLDLLLGLLDVLRAC